MIQCLTKLWTVAISRSRFTAERLPANVLSSGAPSAYSTQLLERNALVKRYQQNPEQVLAELYSGLGKPDERDRLFALAELSFAHAEAVQNRSYYLSSAVFAYAFLFPENPIDAPDPYDPRLRLALDLYNQDLAPLESHCCILISGALERPGSRGLMNSRAGHARFGRGVPHWLQRGSFRDVR